VLLEPDWKFTHSDVAGIPVKNSIDQSYEFALCIFALTPIALTLFKKRNLHSQMQLCYHRAIGKFGVCGDLTHRNLLCSRFACPIRCSSSASGLQLYLL
jgi:hypothetical protein